MIHSRAWILIFILFCPFVLAIPASQSPAIDPPNAITSMSSFDAPQSSPVPHTTRFTQRPAEPLGPNFNRALLKTRRRIEHYWRWVAQSVLPEVRPMKEDYIFLRSLEDPVFMSTTELRSMSGKIPRIAEDDHRRAVPTTPDSSSAILHFLERELAKRSVSDRQRIADDLHEIVQRMPEPEHASAL